MTPALSRYEQLHDAMATSTETVRWHRAPGRVNLIGEHTDYNDGYALPFAIDRDCVVAFVPSSDGRVRVRSLELEGAVDVAADGSTPTESVDVGWGRFVAGVVQALAEVGREPIGIDAVLSSTVPAGSGLSSSAALEVGLASALCDAAGLELDPVALARAGQRAETAATGVTGGVMDQLTAVLGRAGHALLVDFRDLGVEPLPLPSSLSVLVVHSGITRTLEASAYNERRQACDAAAERLGIATLRDATLADVAADPRARHVVTENERVLEFAAALPTADGARLGALLLAGHASLRDDFEVSTPELDLLVELLVEHGAHGARLTGAGFGGCVIALVDPSDAGDVVDESVVRYRSATGLQPTAFLVRSVDGAGPFDPAGAR
jgi:galactokinase